MSEFSTPPMYVHVDEFSVVPSPDPRAAVRALLIARTRTVPHTRPTLRN